MNRNELEETLSQARVDFSQWGTVGQSKPIDKLLQEINEEESFLWLRDKTLIRCISAVFITVTHLGKTLKEDRAVWKNSNRPPRVRSIGGSVAGKMMLNEDPFVAASRELREELQISVGTDRFVFIKRTKRCVDSYSFPGLLAEFDEVFLSVELEASEYREGGYIESTDDKTTYFVWV